MKPLACNVEKLAVFLAVAGIAIFVFVVVIFLAKIAMQAMLG